MGDAVQGLFAAPRGWVEAFGEIAKFIAQVLYEIFGLRVFRFFGKRCVRPGF